MLHYFEFKDENSSKFWEISLEDKTITTCYGKLNSAGKSTTKAFSDTETAQKEFDKLVKEKTEKGYVLKEFPFPFFGAGYGHYYEWAEVCIRFINKPTNEQLKQIIKLAPTPIKPSESDLSGKFLMAGSDQFVNMWIEEAYGETEKTDTKKGEQDEETEEEDYDDYDDYGEDACFDVSDEAADAFEAHIEQWLNETHAICPIEFAYRMEDGEAGGTELSAWHRKSLDHINDFITKWTNDEATFKQTEKEFDLFKYVVAGIFNFGNVAYDLVPEKLIDTFFPDQKVKRLLNKPDLTEALAYIKSNSKDGYTQDILKSELKQLIKAKNYQKINQLTEAIIDFIHEDYSFMLYHVGELCDAALKEKNYNLRNKLVKQLSNKENGSTSLSGDSASCDYINNIGSFAFKLHGKDTWQNAIDVYEMALDIETLASCKVNLQVYCNVLWVLQKDNTGLPVNKILNEKILAKCLPYGPQNPAIFFNAACLYVEMLDYNKALEYIQQAKKYNYNNFNDMIKQITKTEKMFSEFREYKPFVEWLKNSE